jgi:hypothetical protein
MVTEKTLDDKYSWYSSNQLFGDCRSWVQTNTVKRMPKIASMKRNHAKRTETLDKQKFLLKFVAFEGLLQFVDGKFPEQLKIVDDGYQEKLEATIRESNKQSMNTEYYGSYP